MELIIYSFFLFNLIPAIHTEIFIYGIAVSYGRNGLSVGPARIRRDMTFVRKISLGRTNVTAAEFFSFIRGISVVYKVKKYDLFRANCRHFSRLLIEELKPDRAFEGIWIYYSDDSLINPGVRYLEQCNLVSHTCGMIYNEVSCLLKKLIRAFAWAQVWNSFELFVHGIPIIVSRAVAILGNRKSINRTPNPTKGQIIPWS